jgi:thioredoxin reductase
MTTGHDLLVVGGGPTSYPAALYRPAAGCGGRR